MFTSKFIWTPVLFLSFMQLSEKVFFTTGTSHWTTRSSLKSISRVNLSVNAPAWYIRFVRHIVFLFFLSNHNAIDVASCFFKPNFLIALIHCYLWYPFPSLNWVIKLTLSSDTVSYNIWKSWSDAYHKIISLTAWP